MAPEDLGQLTIGDCRNAARVVHKAEFGKEARAPWGVGADQSEFSPDKITNDSSQMMGYAAGVCLASARACAAF